MYKEQSSNIRKLASARAKEAIEAQKVAEENEMFLGFYRFLTYYDALER